MSGLVRTYCACSRTQRRSSGGVSPSYVAARSPGSASASSRGQLVGGQRLGRRQVERGRPAPEAPPRRRRPRSAPAAGRPGTCPTRCRWRRRRAGRRGPARPPRAGAPTARRPRRRAARRTPAGSTQSGHSTVRAGRAGTSWTCTSRSARRPEARRARAAAGSKPAAALGGPAARSSARRYAVGCAGGLGWCRVGPARRPEPHQGAPVVDLSISSADRGDVTVVHVAGEIDVYTAPILRERLDEQIAGRPPPPRRRPAGGHVPGLDRPRRAGRRAQAGPRPGRHAQAGLHQRADPQGLRDHRPGQGLPDLRQHRRGAGRHRLSRARASEPASLRALLTAVPVARLACASVPHSRDPCPTAGSAARGPP